MESKVLRQIYKRRVPSRLDILKYPNPVLELKSEDVGLPLEVHTKNVISRLRELLTANVGHENKELTSVGLAACQIGILKNVFVYSQVPPSKKSKKLRKGTIEVVCNPIILGHGKEKTVMPEGNVSYPGKMPLVARHRIIEVVYYNQLGRVIKRKLTGWDARVFQHLMGMLNGLQGAPVPHPKTGN